MLRFIFSCAINASNCWLSLIEIEELKTKLTTLSPKITDKATQIKLNEVVKLLTPLSKSHKVDDNNLINLLQYYELLNEIKSIHESI